MLLRLAAVLGIASVVALYLYARLLRAAKTLGAGTHRLRWRLLTALAVAVLSYLAIQITTLPAIVILHVFMLSVLLQCGDILLRLLFRRQYNKHLSVWKWLLDTSLLPLVLAAALLIYGYFNMMNIVPTRYTVYTDKAIRPEGYRVALIADVHFGVSLDEKKLLDVADRISAEQADLVVLCGDIIDSSITREGVSQVFAALGSIGSELGTYYVYGNHDRPGRSQPFSLSDLNAAIEANGITILQDKMVVISSDLTLAGRDDRGYSGRSGRLSPDVLLENADPQDFILLLDHQPYEYALDAAAGADLILSGHTHNGQLWPIGRMQHLLRVNDQVYGHAYVTDRTQAIVTSGLAGWAYPIKTGARAEYVIIDILPQ